MTWQTSRSENRIELSWLLTRHCGGVCCQALSLTLQSVSRLNYQATRNLMYKWRMRLFVSQIQRSSAHNHAGGLGGSCTCCDKSGANVWKDWIINSELVLLQVTKFFGNLNGPLLCKWTEGYAAWCLFFCRKNATFFLYELNLGVYGRFKCKICLLKCDAL